MATWPRGQAGEAAFRLREAWEWSFRIDPQTIPIPELPHSLECQGAFPTAWTICQALGHSRQTCDQVSCCPHPLLPHRGKRGI